MSSSSSATPSSSTTTNSSSNVARRLRNFRPRPAVASNTTHAVPSASASTSSAATIIVQPDINRNIDQKNVYPAINAVSDSASAIAAAKKKRKPRDKSKRRPALLDGTAQPAKRVQDEEQPSTDEDQSELFKQLVLPIHEPAEPESSISDQILRLYEAQRASPDALRAREILIHRLSYILNRERWDWGHDHTAGAGSLVIEAFGSVRFGLATSSSDLDLCVCDPYRPEGLEASIAMADGRSTGRRKDKNAGELPEIYSMRELAQRLRRRGYQRVTPVPFAGVPIVKFEAEIIVRGQPHLIQADINMNERFGVYNSKLLNAYCNLHPDIRPLCVFLKFWAKQRRLNDPSGESGTVSLSSYTLILLAISYLQTISVLPNLQSAELIAAAQIERVSFHTKSRKLQGRRSRIATFQKPVCWDVTFVEELPEGMRSSGPIASDIGLAKLARGFFEYYGSADKGRDTIAVSGTGGSEPLNVDRKVVSISRGGVFDRMIPFDAHDPHAVQLERLAITTEDLGLDPDQEGQNDVEQEQEQDHERGMNEQNGMMSIEEIRRQSEEDQAIAAMAEDDIISRPDPRARSQSMERNREREWEERRAVAGIQEVEKFVEPLAWSLHKLVVQDPFLLVRNTAQNILPKVVDHIFAEMRRAVSLMDLPGATLESICASAHNDELYLSTKMLRRDERERRRLNEQREIRKMDQQAAASLSATTEDNRSGGSQREKVV